MQTVYLDPRSVPQHLRRDYTGAKFQAQVCESVTIPAGAGLWDGGSRDKYSLIELATGDKADVPGQDAAPWDLRVCDGATIELKPGYAVVRHCMFQGKDLGLTFYLHPDNAAALLPAPVAELSPHESLVLVATASLKASYNGRDRYAMARDEHGCCKALGDTPWETELLDTASDVQREGSGE